MAKKILIGLGSLIAVLLIVGFVLPNTVTVARSATINAPSERIYALVATPRQWPQWSPWNGRDPNMTITYSGPESGSGATWSWLSKSQGDGSMTMVDAQPPKAIGFALTLVGMGPPSQGRFDLAPSGASTDVTWTMTSTMGMGPVGGWIGLFFRSMITKDFDSGLASLKKLAEMPSAPEPAPAAGGEPAAASPAASGGMGTAPEPAPKPKP